MNQEEWEAEFEKYKLFPEYQRLNMHMTLEEFKVGAAAPYPGIGATSPAPQPIYWMEYMHRMWGRALGLAFVVPFAYFAARRRIPRDLYKRLGLMFAIGGGQGAVGWWMVRSGLEAPEHEWREPRVSPYRLTSHLTVAITLYSLLAWTSMDILRGAPKALALAEPALSRIAPKMARFRTISLATSCLLGVTVVSGAPPAPPHFPGAPRTSLPRSPPARQGPSWPATTRGTRTTISPSSPADGCPRTCGTSAFSRPTGASLRARAWCSWTTACLPSARSSRLQALLPRRAARGSSGPPSPRPRAALSTPCLAWPGRRSPSASPPSCSTSPSPLAPSTRWVAAPLSTALPPSHLHPGRRSGALALLPLPHALPALRQGRLPGHHPRRPSGRPPGLSRALAPRRSASVL